MKKNENLNKEIEQRIRELRARRDISQEELAARVGYKGRSSISRIESDSRTLPIEMVPKIADALSVTPEYLMFGEIEEGFSVEDMDLVSAYHKASPKIRNIIKELLDLD